MKIETHSIAWKGGTYVGQLNHENIPHGVGIHKITTGNLLVYKGSFVSGKYHGRGTLTTLKDGTVFTGEFRDNMPNGEGTLDMTTSVTRGTFVQGVPHGPGTMTHPDIHEVYEVEFVQGDLGEKEPIVKRRC
ncbi:hypothetical protein ACHAXN_011183 [Cyclotella atomus]|jgi:hypothetical protein